MITKEHEKTFWGDGYIHSFNCSEVSQMCSQLYIDVKTFQINTLNVGNLLHVNYTMKKAVQNKNKAKIILSAQETNLPEGCLRNSQPKAIAYLCHFGCP